MALPFLIPNQSRAAEAIEIGPSDTHMLPGGKEADGIIGDFLLRNDQVEAVISGDLPLRRANMSTFYGGNGITPGCLYDLTLRGENNDQITIFTPTGQSGDVSYVRILSEGPEEAAVETVITAPGNEGIEERHEYRLQDGWPGVLVVSTFRNHRDKVFELNTGDRWTTFLRTGKFQDIHWADAVDPSDRAGYAYGAVEWEDRRKVSGNVRIEPGASVTFARFLAVGRSPAEAIGRVAAFRGGTGTLKGRLTRSNGEAVSTATIELKNNDGQTVGYVNSDGRFEWPLPSGTYSLTAIDLGRLPVERSVEIVSGQTVDFEAELNMASGIRVAITDDSRRPIPCKVQFIGVNGTKSPNLGPPNRAHGCRDQYHSEDGHFSVQLDPGDYRVVVTRGVEYSHLVREIQVKAGAFMKLEGQLKRLVDSAGWISADFHNHSTPSGDNTCGTDDRIINLAAEHIEFAPTTEHNRFYDWQPHIEKLGLAWAIATVPGMELTGSGAHFNSFPFEPVPHRQDNGAPVWNRDPRINAVTLRHYQGDEPDRWVQINHPDMIDNFTDRDGDGIADGGYLSLGTLIDGLETQNFRASQILTGRPFNVYQDNSGNDRLTWNREVIWLQLLNAGHRLIGMAVADAHSVHGNGVGGWRMYFPSQTDEPAEIDWREISREAKAGRSILTTGPFLEVVAEGQYGPGADVRASGGVDLHIRVQCTDWIDIDRVQILVNGRREPSLNFTRESHPGWFADGVVKFDRKIEVPLQQDAHIIVVAYDEDMDLSLGYGTSDQSSLRPCAYNNPIYVDVDGNGFEPNGDMLGYELMTKRFTPEEAKRALAERKALDQ